MIVQYDSTSLNSLIVYRRHLDKALIVVHKPSPVDNAFQHGLKVFQNDDLQVIYLRYATDAILQRYWVVSCCIRRLLSLDSSTKELYRYQLVSVVYVYE